MANLHNRSLYAWSYESNYYVSHLYPARTVPIGRLLRAMPSASLSLRKFIVTATRIQGSLGANTYLDMEYDNLPEYSKFVADPIHKDLTVPFDTLIGDLNYVLQSPIQSSILSFYARVERPNDESEFLEQKHKMLIKELSASNFTDLPQQLDYTGLFTDQRDVKVSEHCPMTPHRLYQIWNQTLDSVILKLDQGSTILYPKYNTRKNVSHHTSMNLNSAQNGDPQDFNRTSFDLLAFYHACGERVGGPCELRTVWRPSDLKPRAYYAIGGDCYWSSLYISPICKLIQELLPSTNPFTRFDVKRLTISPLDPSEIIYTYDYTSFTTSLSELKYFLTLLGHRLRGVQCRALDTREGLFFIDVGEYILEYNQSVNLNAEFSIHRHGDPITAQENTMFQKRSGMLGVPGNIGFSTSNHGVSLAGFSDRPDRDSCVGDDVLTRLFQIHAASFIDHTNLLGTIAVDKFTSFHSDPYGMDLSATQRFKYLKRPITVDYLGFLEVGILLTMPKLETVLFHRCPDTTRDYRNPNIEDVAKTFVSSVGKFFDDLLRTNLQPSMFERDLILGILKVAYFYLGIPKEGALYGSSIRKRGSKVPYRLYAFAPPLVDECFYEPWEDPLCRFSAGQWATIPMVVDCSEHRDFLFVGDVQQCTTTPADEILFLLGYFEKEIVMREIMIGEGFWSSDLRRFLTTDGKILVQLRLIRDLPSWYSDYMQYLSCSYLT